MTVPETTRLGELEAESTRLKKLLVETVLEDDVIKDALEETGGRSDTQGVGATLDGGAG